MKHDDHPNLTLQMQESLRRALSRELEKEYSTHEAVMRLVWAMGPVPAALRRMIEAELQRVAEERVSVMLKIDR